MKPTFKKTLVALTLPTLLLSACGEQAAPVEQSVQLDDGSYVKGGGGKADTSVEAVFVDMEFDGEVVVGSSWGLDKKIEDQLLYTIGQLNGDNSVSRLDKLELTDVTSEQADDGILVTYHAKLMVAWGERENVPASYTFKLPRDIRRDAQEGFFDSYGEDCVDWGAHPDVGSMWYYYRPNAYRCDLVDEDIVEFDAAVSVSEVNTTGKYPEYHKVWEDDALEVVAVFGKYEDDATSNSDAGISAYNEFLRDLEDELDAYELATEPAEIPSSPGVELPEAIFRATLPDGRTVQVVALLVDNVRTAGYAFDQRYAELSRTADLLAYNGHAGLGSNIRAMARKGDWQQGQYSIVFMNGCDTYAYVDTALADAHADVNPDDDIGTKYVDLVMNAMPSYFSNMSESTMVLLEGLMSYESPQTYERMFEEISSSQVVLVSGEQDNEYVPGFEDEGSEEPGEETWQGMDEAGSVAADEEQRFETPTLGTGTYRFEMSGTNDADLYVRIGLAPTVDEYDCRPYRTGSNEVCEVELSSATKVHVMVRGWASSSDWELVGKKVD